ncbi:MAG TPA: right-handed parallel beta-helix repeat-containing protein [Anaerolineales bacterium]|nr:right-handed parallel beta-helix repeat-containing protein [Anaerolineales bacterium]HRQ92171.1 right-handed parallel beta-helix repeat-containing protein [Anaerolineales bacterium]
MNSSFRFKLLSAAMAFVLIFSLAAPITVFANESTPEEPTEEAPLGEEATEIPDAIQTSEATEAPDAIQTSEATETPEATQTSEASETPEATQTSEATEAPETEEEQLSVAEVVEVLADTGTVLLDSAGVEIPLTSEVAVAALTAPDPIGCPPGVVPTTWGGTGVIGVDCTISYSSIQAAINDAAVTTGWTIYIDPGTFYENVNVSKSVTLQGSGQGVTIVKPAVTGVNTCQGSCPNATNTVILVSANGVSIFDLTVDGDSDLLNNGLTVGGVDVNSHNGIITNTHTSLTVEDVTVQNVYARGIQMGSSNGSFNFSNNTVDNVQGDFFSMGIFGYTSGGVIDNNQISNVGDGIALNWSKGTQITNNTVTNAGTGIHTDNTNGADVISGNTITNGKTNSYGIFVFAPYEQVTVKDNDISGVYYGLTLSGNGSGDPVNDIQFEGNEVNASVAGAYITSDVWNYFKSDVKTTFTDNTISGGNYGFLLESQAAADYVPGYYGASSCAGGDCVVELTLVCNSVTGGVFEASGLGFWDGNVTPNYNGVYLVDDSGNVCTVSTPPSTSTDNQGGAGDASFVPPVTGGGLFIPVTGGNTRVLNLDQPGTQALLALVAKSSFPLQAEGGLYTFTCVLKSVTTLTPDQYIVQGDKTVTSVGQCSYWVNGVERTITLALTYLGQGGSYDPGDVLLVGLNEAEFGAFANSGNPFDANNFMLASSLELKGKTFTTDLESAEMRQALEDVASVDVPLEEQDGEYNLSCVLEGVTELDEAITLEDGQAVTALGVCSYLVGGAKHSVLVALTLEGQDGSYSPGQVLALGLSGDNVASFVGTGNPEDLNGVLQPSSIDPDGSVN